MLDLKLLFPKVIDNQFNGRRFALWFFYFITAVTLWRSQHHLFAPDGGAQTIATIPLDTFSQGAAATVIGIFAMWGVSQIIIGLIYLAAAVRYRSLIPMLYLLMIVEYIGRAGVGHFKPIMLAGTAPGGVINLPAAAVFTIMLVLSLWRKKSTF